MNWAPGKMPPGELAECRRAKPHVAIQYKRSEIFQIYPVELCEGGSNAVTSVNKSGQGLGVFRMGTTPNRAEGEPRVRAGARLAQSSSARSGFPPRACLLREWLPLSLPPQHPPPSQSPRSLAWWTGPLPSLQPAPPQLHCPSLPHAQVRLDRYDSLVAPCPLPRFLHMLFPLAGTPFPPQTEIPRPAPWLASCERRFTPPSLCVPAQSVPDSGTRPASPRTAPVPAAAAQLGRRGQWGVENRRETTRESSESGGEGSELERKNFGDQGSSFHGRLPDPG